MINKKAFSKADLENRIAKADITRLENRKQFWILVSIFVVTLVSLTVGVTCFDGEGNTTNSCGKSSTDK